MNQTLIAYGFDGAKVSRAQQMPMAICPHCEKEFQWEDYYDVREGDDRECPKCGKTIYVVAVDHIKYLDLSTKP